MGEAFNKPVFGSIEIEAPFPNGLFVVKPFNQTTGLYGGDGGGFGAGLTSDAPEFGGTNEYSKTSPSGSVALWLNVKSSLLHNIVGG